MNLGKDSGRLVTLVLIAAGLGIYHILTAVMCDRDCWFYIEFAQSFQDGFTRAFDDIRFGYPLMIYGVHKFLSVFGVGDSLESWIYVGQGVTLFCRMGAIAGLYFVCKRCVEDKYVFFSMLIIVFLPYPAKYGADVLRDWPFLMLFSWSVLFVLKGFDEGRLSLFVVSALISGLGYFIRPVSLQVIVYLAVFSVFNLLFNKFKLSRVKSSIAGFIFLLIFMIPVLIYINQGGESSPSKLQSLVRNKLEAEKTAGDVSKSEMVIELAEGVFENGFWYFTGFGILGLIDAFRRKSNPKISAVLFIGTFIGLNFIILILLHLKYGYIGRRHAMPLALFICFYAPRGLGVLSMHMENLFNMNRRKVFKILLGAGIAACLVKLFIPMELDKRHYVKATKWLNKNAGEDEVILVEDSRIGFYAQKKYVHEHNLDVETKADYVVISDRSDDISVYPYESAKAAEFKDKTNKSRSVKIYKITD